ncbi:serine hydrolase domain-containing protein [Actinomadura rudentiformis]|uniref:Beta-lactamase family protein n=1 Tax=Actinomadura rudentiformis TaxID=359158 RepID=A0A6H9YQH6_9ACTN|nr:serine hydrolase domain-containing protein [Actinomadura rudentiformis]KAB2350164.1 beta-lactamase family protein [Actinomadura rudentiformis]
MTKTSKKSLRQSVLVPPLAGLIAALSGTAAFALNTEGTPTQLQRDADALRETGAAGVLAEVRTPGGRAVARSGVADLKTGAPVHPDSYYRIGSTTKTFVATVALQLAGEGKLALTDTVERWLPGVVRGNDNDGTKITVRHLLGHTSGLPDYLDDVPLEKARTPEDFRRERFRTYSPERLVAMAMQHRPAFKPGRNWAYSNTNYILVGMIIEKASGRPWQQEVHERIIEPLGLRHTLIPGTSAHLPQPNMTAYRRLVPGGPEIDVSTVASGHPDGSLISTTGDVNTFFQALLGGRLLRPAQLRQMQRTRSAKPFQEIWRDAGYGLGLMKRRLACGDWVWFHGGGGWNYVTDNAVTPDGRRTTTVFYTSRLGPDQSPIQQLKTSATLIDNTLCAS